MTTGIFAACGEGRLARLAAGGELSQPLGEDGPESHNPSLCIDPTEGGGQRDVAARSTRHRQGTLRPGFPGPFTGSQSQQVTFLAGAGEWGIENQGLNRWGMNFVKGRDYEGYVWVRAEKPATLVAALESRDGAACMGKPP